MTTAAAAQLYEAQHQKQMEGRRWAVFNPHDKYFDELPIIYGFNNGGEPGWYHAQLLASDGAGLGSHICSAESYMEHDLGILEGTRPDRHKGFCEHFPDGYRMEFIAGHRPFDHPGLRAAFALNQERRKAAEENQ